MPRPLPLLLLAPAAALALACSEPCESSGEGPNVVVVVVDTLRADHLPFYGYGKNTAPFLSKLAARGVVFDRAWSTSSWTAPSTASIFTGLYPIQHGVTQGLKLVQDVQKAKQPSLELNRIPGPLETMPELMHTAGYRTFGIADNPNICEAEGFESGFCDFHTFDYRQADAVNAKLAEWAPRIREGGKWFVYLHYMDPHFPYNPRGPWYRAPEGVPPIDGNNVKNMTAEDARKHLDALYDSEIRYADEHIREAFELLGVDDDTVVVFVADHGEELMQRSEHLQHEFQLYSELVHVPLVVVHPGVERTRQRVDANVSLIDILPTLRDMLGAPPSDQDVGTSLVPYYTELALPPNDRPVFAMRSRLEVLGGQEKRAIIRGTDKLIVTVNENGEHHELYDLETDWGELQNRVATSAERAAELHQAWKDFEGAARIWAGERTRVELSPEDVDKLNELGYAE